MKKYGRPGINQNAGQRKLLFPIVEAAWKIYVTATGDAVHCDEFRYAETESIFGKGVRSIKDLNQSDDFDKLALHFAILSGNDAMIARFSNGDVRRTRWLMEQLLRRISENEGVIYGWGYAAKILEHMRLAPDINDVPNELLFHAYQALDTHFRRLKKRGHAPHGSHHGHAHRHAEAA